MNESLFTFTSSLDCFNVLYKYLGKWIRTVKSWFYGMLLFCNDQGSKFMLSSIGLKLKSWASKDSAGLNVLHVVFQ